MKVVEVVMVVPLNDLEEDDITPDRLRDELGDYLMEMYSFTAVSVGVEIKDDGQEGAEKKGQANDRGPEAETPEVEGAPAEEEG
jgi:hypothetical protein